MAADWIDRLPSNGELRLIEIVGHYSKVLPTKWIPEPLIEDLYPSCGATLEFMRDRGVMKRTIQRRTSGEPVVCWRRA